MFRKQMTVLFVTVCIGFPVWGSEYDPTRPPTVKNKILKPIVKAKKPPKPKVKSKNWVLSSTLVASDRRTAVINDKVLSLGEKINGSKLIDIQSGKVKLLAKGKTRTLEIIKKDVKIKNVKIKKRKNFHKPTRKNGQ